MDVIELTRQLGAAIQADDRYIAFAEARKANDEDMELNGLIGKLNLIQMNYSNESAKETPDDAKLEEMDSEFRQIYAQIMLNENMKKYEAAKADVDALMNQVVQLLSKCANGEDPETCSVDDEASCTGNCGTCGGCG